MSFNIIKICVCLNHCHILETRFRRVNLQVILLKGCICTSVRRYDIKAQHICNTSIMADLPNLFYT